MPATKAAHSSQGFRIGGAASCTIKRARTAWHAGEQRNSVDVMETSVDGRHPAQGTGHVRRVPWSPLAWAQAVRVAGGIVIQVLPWALTRPACHSRLEKPWPSLAEGAAAVRAQPGGAAAVRPGAHPRAAAPAAGRRGVHSRAAEAAGLADPWRACRRAAIAAVLAAGRLPRARRAAARHRGGGRPRAVARRPAVHHRVPVWLGPAPGQHRPARDLPTRRHHPAAGGLRSRPACS